jgi:muramoyltetrapeptide carboxypeptidase
MNKARSLKSGDLIAIVAPAGPVSPDALMQGISRVESWGFRTKLYPSVLARYGYLAGSDAHRAADFMSAWADPDVAGIICARGGYGAMRILPLIDWSIIRAMPKFFCGFSDITALHLAIQQQANLITFHGPMAGAFGQATRYNTSSLLAAMSNRVGPRTIPWPDRVEGGAEKPRPNMATAGQAEGGAEMPRSITIQPGQAEGRLCGGNLTLLCSLIGTPWEPDLTDKIVVIEEVDEVPYRVDRMLTQLLLAGQLQRAGAVLFGDSPSCMAGPEGNPSFTLLEVLNDRLGPLNIPVHYGFPCGHSEYRSTLPLGAMARLDAASGAVTILESPCS